MEKGSLEFGNVTPFLGVWIEIFRDRRERNSKNVTPFLGVWIEITTNSTGKKYMGRHSLLGSVD